LFVSIIFNNCSDPYELEKINATTGTPLERYIFWDCTGADPSYGTNRATEIDGVAAVNNGDKVVMDIEDIGAKANYALRDNVLTVTVNDQTFAGGVKNGYKLFTRNSGSGSGWGYLFGSFEYVGFYLDTSEIGREILLYFIIGVQTNAGSVYADMKPGTTVVLAPDSGLAYELLTDELRSVTIPSNFRGWISFRLYNSDWENLWGRGSDFNFSGMTRINGIGMSVAGKLAGENPSRRLIGRKIYFDNFSISDKPLAGGVMQPTAIVPFTGMESVAIQYSNGTIGSKLRMEWANAVTEE